jgi:amidophosphoribosyltransferase
MCGIIGVVAHGSFETPKEEKVRQEVIRYLTTELLLLTQARGKDATGLSVCFEDGDYMGLKMGVSAQEFISRFGGKETDYDGFVNVWRKKKARAKMVIGHCRKPSTTVGAGTEDNANNHPIKIGDIVGVHNGTLKNYEVIFKNLGGAQDGKVDSEAIFRLLQHYTNEGADPFTMEVVQETCKRLSGEYAVLAFNGNNPYQMAAFRDKRPLEFALIKPLKLILIASDETYLRMVLTRYNRMAYLYQVTSKFPELKKADVELKTTIDSTAFLFNTEQDVTAETKIEDLYITEKIPFVGKIWEKATATYYNRNTSTINGHGSVNGNATTGGAAVKKMTEVIAASPLGASGSGGRAAKQTGETQTSKAGLVWDEKDRKYSSANPASELKKHNNVLITCIGGKVTDLASGDVVPVELEKKGFKASSSSNHRDSSQRGTSRDEFNFTPSGRNVDELIGDPAKINLIEVADRKHFGIAQSGNLGRGRVEPSDIVRSRFTGNTKERVAEVDVTIDHEALERAVKAATSKKNFSTDEEVATYVEIPTVSTMKNMELHSLINRIQRYIFKEAFYAGYLQHKEESSKVIADAPGIDTYARSMLERTKASCRRAQDKIRNIKALTAILDDVASSDTFSDRLIDAVNLAVRDGRELNATVLQQAFRPGDLKSMPVVAKAIEVIKDFSSEGEG